ncbi:aminoacyl-tRNA hydrolase [Calidithermus timidus]|jgi:PTH1 family peptidyl-tRNA hydrolase|uniref:aminoacyl-tRNA hydrolase n=1 Tax=Calidithermus timidus TaxID=307124 RepID=UPI0003608932|nr:aminoacyl-tRNA hydrolase [Calidithermus timidus]
MFLIVGQGNPGLQYARTKHNVGFMVLDRLASPKDYRLKGNAFVAELSVGEEKGWLMKPTTFYNATGEAVAPFARFYKIPPERILVIHDELDLPPGRLRFKVGGGNAGNYGLESISKHLGSTAFHRLRIGIGKPPSPEEGATWVLSPFRFELLPVMERVLDAAAQLARDWVSEAPERIQQKYNGLNFASDASQMQ